MIPRKQRQTNDIRPSHIQHQTEPARKILETYERRALPLQRKYLGEPYGFFVTHIGPMSRVVHLWQYESLADRERRRDAMEADPEWQAYRRVALEEDTLVDMENQILKPVSFFVPR
ncbi:NIPSNAP family protein [Bradyrhizobium erythrophlei]|uniref:NIPSNAP family protein n=1 Tax=Bradyrhizobium erythrophlei TaxID=1437360 RepID=UPI0030B8412E